MLSRSRNQCSDWSNKLSTFLMLTDFVVTAPEGRNVYSFVDEKPPSSDRSDICRPDIAPLGLGKYFAYKTINISPPLGAEEAISTTKSVSTRIIEFHRLTAPLILL